MSACMYACILCSHYVLHIRAYAYCNVFYCTVLCCNGTLIEVNLIRDSFTSKHR